MDKQPAIEDLAWQLLLFSAHCCISIIMNDPLVVPMKSTKLDQEESDLVDFLYQHGTKSFGGHFDDGIYQSLVDHLNEKHPGQNRSVSTVQNKFYAVRSPTPLIV